MEIKDTLISEELRKNYEGHLGSVDWKGKKVLDIGADTGTTAEFFLNKGAEFVVAVEGYWHNYRVLKDRVDSGIFGDKVVYNEMMVIRSPYDLIYLITKWDWVDIVKIDIEGSEIYLAYIPDDIIKIPRSYVIDFHSREIEHRLRHKLLTNNYTFYNEGKWNVIYAENNDTYTSKERI